MTSSYQLKAGRELMSNSREAWLGYYVFVIVALGTLGGGYLLVRRAGFEGGEYWLAMIGVLTLALVSLGIAVACHILGHIVDTLEELKAEVRSGQARENGT